jgi:hypothetical protein
LFIHLIQFGKHRTRRIALLHQLQDTRHACAACVTSAAPPRPYLHTSVDLKPAHPRTGDDSSTSSAWHNAQNVCPKAMFACSILTANCCFQFGQQFTQLCAEFRANTFEVESPLLFHFLITCCVVGEEHLQEWTAAALQQAGQTLVQRVVVLFGKVFLNNTGRIPCPVGCMRAPSGSTRHRQSGAQ